MPLAIWTMESSDHHAPGSASHCATGSEFLRIATHMKAVDRQYNIRGGRRRSRKTTVRGHEEGGGKKQGYPTCIDSVREVYVKSKLQNKPIGS